VGNLAKQEWVLVYAIDEATTAISTSVLADINRILGEKPKIEGRSHAATRRLPSRRGVVDGEVDPPTRTPFAYW